MTEPSIRCIERRFFRWNNTGVWKASCALTIRSVLGCNRYGISTHPHNRSDSLLPSQHLYLEDHSPSDDSLVRTSCPAYLVCRVGDDWFEAANNAALRLSFRTNISLASRNHGTSWLSSIIEFLWTLCHDEWLSWNNALHDHTHETKRHARLDPARSRILHHRHQCSPYVRATRAMSQN
jgi:hypothetical protein